MKRKYEKPVFYAEGYVFSSSIAACDIDIDITAPLTIERGVTKLCPVDDNGHFFGGKKINKHGKRGYKGSISEEIGDKRDFVTLFNDGDATGCEYDWDGRANIVAQTGDSFAASFFGNEANPGNHAPAYNGQVFMS